MGCVCSVNVDEDGQHCPSSVLLGSERCDVKGEYGNTLAQVLFKKPGQTSVAQTHPESIEKEVVQVPACVQIEDGSFAEVYELGKILGSGQFGQVFQCTRKYDGKQFASKAILKSRLQDSEGLDLLVKEVQVLNKLHGHPGVVLLEHVMQDEHRVHIVLELCRGGDLNQKLLTQGKLSEERAREYFRSIFEVILRFHQLGIIHRDIKPENFLLLDDSPSSSIKAIDFGLSVFHQPGQSHSDIAGSLLFMPPEVLAKSYGPECDIWSAGAMLYMLLCGRPPFKGESVLHSIKATRYSELQFHGEEWAFVSDEGRDLIRQLLHRDPSLRVSASDALRHKWFQ
eukprot:TRINITY_DN896_c0_g1_i2.p1 TRINITY_DN896_c0_g1~~TRINITY_DN896_c0_g1_i2.p1  ORF type:complete len:340 (-),score=23.33 TRINITY_DN896_c0_g1_i2:737-1756(-)